ncbi:hypothetical protein D3C75_1260830 [compost metagenome]
MAMVPVLRQIAGSSRWARLLFKAAVSPERRLSSTYKPVMWTGGFRSPLIRPIGAGAQPRIE